MGSKDDKIKSLALVHIQLSLDLKMTHSYPL